MTRATSRPRCWACRRLLAGKTKPPHTVRVYVVGGYVTCCSGLACWAKARKRAGSPHQAELGL